MSGEVGPSDLDLLSAGHLLELGNTPFRLGGGDEHDPTRPEPVRRLHLGLEALRLVVDGYASGSAAYSRDFGDRNLETGVPKDHDLRRRSRDDLGPGDLHQLDDAVQPAGEANSRGRRPALSLRQPVVPSPTSKRVLGTGTIRGEDLEDRPGVVVETAHKVRIVSVVDRRGIKQPPDRGPGGRALLTEVVGDAWRLGFERLVLRDLAVEQQERVGLEPALAVAMQLFFQGSVVGLQQLEVRGPTFGVADGVELQPQLVESELAQPGGGDFDHFRVQGWALGPDRLDVELEKLAVATLLRAVVPEHRPHQKQA